MEQGQAFTWFCQTINLEQEHDSPNLRCTHLKEDSKLNSTRRATSLKMIQMRIKKSVKRAESKESTQVISNKILNLYKFKAF
jgi:hypothetical protein